MFGAIIGDIVGSVYEWNNIKTKDFPLFREDCFFTDDTVMTIAVAEAFMQTGCIGSDWTNSVFIDSMKKWGRMYPNAGYGGRFGEWLRSDSREPYNSFGNGAAMRVSPIPFQIAIYNSAPGINDTTLMCANLEGMTRICAEVTHNHPEGIKGAQATAECIMSMRFGREFAKDVELRKPELRKFIESKFGYNLSLSLDEIRPTYKFDETCQGTVPQAITAFLESTDFEDAIRNAISLGGDSDTLAAITGSIAEAAYGIPKWIKDKAWEYLDDPIRDACNTISRFKTFQ